MGVLILFLLSIAGGILYRMGGSSAFHKQVRRFGVPTVFIFTLLLLQGLPGSVKVGISYFLTFGAMYGAISTYWDSVFGKDNLWFAGLGVGLAALPNILASGSIGWVIVRSIILALTWGFLNLKLQEYQGQKILLWNKDIVEEFTRGFLVIITGILLCLK